MNDARDQPIELDALGKIAVRLEQQDAEIALLRRRIAWADRYIELLLIMLIVSTLASLILLWAV